MKKIILTIFCNSVLLLTLCLPADASMTIGLISTASLSGVTQGKIDQLSKELSQLAGEPVKVRRFENNAALTNWLLRFQEVDAAIVPPSFITLHPAGALNRISDLHAQKTPATLLSLVVRSNLANNKTEQIKTTFLELNTSEEGRKALSQIGLTGVTLPGKALNKKKLAPNPPPAQIVEKQPTEAHQKKPTPPAKTEPEVIPQAPAQPTVTKKPTTEPPVATTRPAAKESQQGKSNQVESSSIKKPNAVPAAKPLASIEKQLTAVDEKAAPAVKNPSASKPQPSASTAPETQPTTSKEVVKKEKPQSNKRLTNA